MPFKFTMKFPPFPLLIRDWTTVDKGVDKSWSLDRRLRIDREWIVKNFLKAGLYAPVEFDPWSFFFNCAKYSRQILNKSEKLMVEKNLILVLKSSPKLEKEQDGMIRAQRPTVTLPSIKLSNCKPHSTKLVLLVGFSIPLFQKLD